MLLWSNSLIVVVPCVTILGTTSIYRTINHIFYPESCSCLALERTTGFTEYLEKVKKLLFQRNIKKTFNQNTLLLYIAVHSVILVKDVNQKSNILGSHLLPESCSCLSMKRTIRSQSSRVRKLFFYRNIKKKHLNDRNIYNFKYIIKTKIYYPRKTFSPLARGVHSLGNY